MFNILELYRESPELFEKIPKFDKIKPYFDLCEELLSFTPPDKSKKIFAKTSADIVGAGVGWAVNYAIPVIDSGILNLDDNQTILFKCFVGELYSNWVSPSISNFVLNKVDPEKTVERFQSNYTASEVIAKTYDNYHVTKFCEKNFGGSPIKKMLVKFTLAQLCQHTVGNLEESIHLAASNKIFDQINNMDFEVNYNQLPIINSPEYEFNNFDYSQGYNITNIESLALTFENYLKSQQKESFVETISQNSERDTPSRNR